ncbi:hypothetical protein V2K50_26895, partial [Pseudomonas alliivorans]|nr:hypothetical protein [Pseudomonas alliivorans]
LGVEVHFFDFGVGSHHGAGSRKKTGTQHQASAIALECGVRGADTFDGEALATRSADVGQCAVIGAGEMQKVAQYVLDALQRDEGIVNMYNRLLPQTHLKNKKSSS